MKKEFLDRLIAVTYRSKAQTLELLELLDNDVFKLMELEEKLRNNFVGYCPGDKETCDYVLSMGNGYGWFKLTFTKEYTI
jgi:hypothetical protein